jgi:hypothetical protein
MRKRIGPDKENLVIGRKNFRKLGGFGVEKTSVSP